MKENYQIPPGTGIGHVHLKVADLQRSLDFYCGLLGFNLMMKYGEDAAFISAGGYHHHIGLNVWHSKNSPSAPKNAPGLYHTAIKYPERIDLANIYKRLLDKSYPLTGAADHGVSEAIYLNDPDENGVELYYDRPQKEWPKDEEGKIIMFTHTLNLQNLLNYLNYEQENKKGNSRR